MPGTSLCSMWTMEFGWSIEPGLQAKHMVYDRGEFGHGDSKVCLGWSWHASFLGV